MGTPEDVAADKHFTPPTLTEMLRAAFMVQLESSANAQAIEDDLIFIKTTFKDWLRTVGLPYQMSEESTRQLLITLVDEP